MKVLRYIADPNCPSSDLDPIEDMLNMVSVLQSPGHVEDLLRGRHGFRNKVEIRRVAKKISLHAEMAVELAGQGLSSRPETSFLPLYYSLLNLNKIILLFLGYRQKLEKDRWHGAVFQPKSNRKLFFNQAIVVKQKGVVPLMYEAKLAGVIPNRGLPVRIMDIYRGISTIGAELKAVTGMQGMVFPHHGRIVRDDANGHYIQVDFVLRDQRWLQPPRADSLAAYSGLRLSHDIEETPIYRSQRFHGTFPDAIEHLLPLVKQQLLSDRYNDDLGWYSHTPLSKRKHVFNEDINILLAFFHLSNVVRYNPENLNEIMKSKYWLLLLALRKHGYLRALKLFWTDVMKEAFDIA